MPDNPRNAILEPQRRTRRARLAPIAVGLVALAILSTFPLFLATGYPAASGGEPSSLLHPNDPAYPAASVSAWIQVAAGAPFFDLPPTFWGSTAVASEITSTNTSWIVNSTPAREFVWPGGGDGDRMDMVNGILHELNGRSVAAPTTAAEFASWCNAIGCHAIFQVPGEIDSPSTAAANVMYVEQTLHFRPDYWEIGNEPALWRNFELPWSQWGNHSSLTPTPAQYATLVHRYISAMRGVDPAIRIVGLPGVGKGSYSERQWLSDVVGVNGPNLSAVAIHVYPAGLGPSSPADATLTNFMSSLNDPAAIPVRLPPDLVAIHDACPRCPAIPILVTELGSAVRGGLDAPFVTGFPQAPYIAAEIIQAIQSNLTNVDYFAVQHNSSGSWFPDVGGSRPVYQLYAEILSRLGARALPLVVSSSVHDVFAIISEGSDSSSPTDLLVVNANATLPITLATAGTGLSTSQSTEVWTWNSSSSEPMARFAPNGLPATWPIPPTSLVLFEQPRVPSYPLVVNESGLPADTRWFLRVGGTTETTNSTQLTFFLPSGLYNQSAFGERAVRVGERFGPTLAPTVTIANTTTYEHVDYGFQYLVSTSATPTREGNTAPAMEWVPAGSTTSILASPAPGYQFFDWEGSGSGSYTGTANPASVTPTGPVSETARFEQIPASEFAVSFDEAGLPNATVWTVQLGNQTRSSSTAQVVFGIGNGTYGYSIPEVGAFEPMQPTGSLTVAGSANTVNVTFSRWYNVTFVESGLGAGTIWSITLGGHPKDSGSPSIAFQEPNGTYGYIVGTTGPFRSESSAGTVRVEGLPVTVPVTFLAATNASGNVSGQASLLLWGGVASAGAAGVVVVVMFVPRWKKRKASTDVPESTHEPSAEAGDPGRPGA